MLVTRSFLSQLTTEQKERGGASVINISSGAGLVTLPGSSAYSITKLADLRLTSFLAAESPHVHALAVHPGIVATDMGIDATFFAPYAKDTVELAGSVVNWAVSQEARFLNGRYISVSWDVEELKARKGEILEKGYLTIGLLGIDRGKAATLGVAQ